MTGYRARRSRSARERPVRSLPIPRNCGSTKHPAHGLNQKRSRRNGPSFHFITLCAVMPVAAYFYTFVRPCVLLMAGCVAGSLFCLLLLCLSLKDVCDDTKG